MSVCVHTSVCTMAGLCVLSILTVWKMSTTPSYLILSRTILRVMKTPVLPTPALVRERHADKTLPCFTKALSDRFWIQIVAWSSGVPAVHCDWSVLAKLLLCFVHLANEVDEALSWFGHSLLGPVSELELPYRPGLAVLQHRTVFFCLFVLFFNHCRMPEAHNLLSGLMQIYE